MLLYKMSASHFCLQAADLGLGTCMLGWFDEQIIKNILSIPEKNRLGLVITLGYEGTDEPKKRVRKSREQMSSRNSYNS